MTITEQDREILIKYRIDQTHEERKNGPGREYASSGMVRYSIAMKWHRFY